MFLTEQGKIVSKLLDNVDDWGLLDYDTPDDFRSIEHKSGLVLWIANGRASLKIRSRSKIPYVQISFFDQYLLWFKVKKIIKKIQYYNHTTKSEKYKFEINKFKTALKEQGFDV